MCIVLVKDGLDTVSESCECVPSSRRCHHRHRGLRCPSSRALILLHYTHTPSLVLLYYTHTPPEDGTTAGIRRKRLVPQSRAHSHTQPAAATRQPLEHFHFGPESEQSLNWFPLQSNRLCCLADTVLFDLWFCLTEEPVMTSQEK